MDSTFLDDDLMLPFSEEPSSPVRPKLKRLKKASSENKVHDPLVSESGDLIEELKKEKLNRMEESESVLRDSAESLFPESGGLIEELRRENFISTTEQELDPLFPESGGLIEELRKEKMDQLEGESKDKIEEDGLDPLFSEPSGLMEELTKEKTGETRVRVSDSPPMKEEEDRLDPLFSEPKTRVRVSDSPPFEDDNDGLDPLFPKSGEYKAYEGEEIEEGGLIEELKQERSAKKRLNWDGDEEIAEKETKNKKNKKEKKERKRKTGKNGDLKPKESVREKRRLEKERRVQLDQLHIETQRLLRETSDASFKPIPVVHKPISSILEKIRLRKLQILKQSSISFQSESAEHECEESQNMKNDDMDLKMGEARDNENNLIGENSDENTSIKSNKNENHSENTSKDEDKFNKESSQSDDTTENNENEKSLSPSLPCSSPVLDSNSDSSSSSDEEEDSENNDKENIDPYAEKLLSTKTLNPKKPSHLKEFLDDEAEEEDDSDHDLTRFNQNNNSSDEENEDNSDNENENDEMLNDLIEPGFKEKKKDKERRNELHLKWMQEQDTKNTTRVLQKLKLGKGEREDDDILSDDESEIEGEEREELGLGFEGKKKSVLKQNNEKLKEMMVKMFDDEDDVYVHSDDEENEEILIRQRLSIQKEDSKIISPWEDEQSKEVFGLIKNLNIAPPPKQAKQTSNFNMLTLGGTSNIYSKASFIGRKTNGSLPSSKKSGVNTRAFIFERDDSNSRSSFLSSDNQSSEKHNQSDMDSREGIESKKPSLAKSSSSQFKPPSISINSNSGENSNSNSSLFEILRQSSVNLSKQNETKTTQSVVAHQFSAFKIQRRFSRVDARN